MSKQQHPTALLEFLQDHNQEQHFNAIYQKLEFEYQTEQLADDNLRTNLYLNNLRQTIEKQAAAYQSAKENRPTKGAPTEFKSFISNFRQDIQEALGMLPKAES